MYNASYKTLSSSSFPCSSVFIVVWFPSSGQVLLSCSPQRPTFPSKLETSKVPKCLPDGILPDRELCDRSNLPRKSISEREKGMLGKLKCV